MNKIVRIVILQTFLKKLVQYNPLQIILPLFILKNFTAMQENKCRHMIKYAKHENRFLWLFKTELYYGGVEKQKWRFTLSPVKSFPFFNANIPWDSNKIHALFISSWLTDPICLDLQIRQYDS